ncbi:MAG: helix-turn-helix transcriptional regulator [Gemmatimonadota bacterium]
MAAAYALLDGDGDIVTAHRLLVGVIEVSERRFDPDDPFLVEALHVLFQICLWAEGGDLFPPFDAVVSDLGQTLPESLWFQNVVLRDPARVSTTALARLDQAIAGLDLETDVVRIERIVRASTYVDRVSLCRDALERVVEDGRRGGAIATAISALMQVCVDDYFVGEWEPARQLANEGVRLCRVHGYGLPRWCFELGDALVAAGRGERERVRTITDAMLNWAVPRGVGGVVGFAQHALTMDALANGDWEGAFQRAARISPPGALQPRVGCSLWVALALVEAAVPSDHRGEAHEHVAEMRRERVERISPRMAMVVDGAEAMITAGQDGLDLFEKALRIPGADRWTFEMARIRLAYGQRFRRERSVAQARVQLELAADVFRRLQARPWTDRAATELRAAGVTADGPYAGPDALTAQEWQVATLAASGLSNKQIAERMFLSHRTISAHLYRIFPKLGITSRAALRDALGSSPAILSTDT